MIDVEQTKRDAWPTVHGVAGTTASDEARKGQAGYLAFGSQRDPEVAAACAGARAGRADEHFDVLRALIFLVGR